ncbi:pentapeptide repeat-containing protein [Clostridium senegalense]|uniref:pentapeptide repeat-containing protein n=1 Tax=Clostridium senegalense TaxID=1465809 RepID=UPI001C11CCC1|nr:pentapeptide repeat-containing protein [Clostridium senegalense]MBU5228150.1 pentapeptide repeat-containing protein [Clostridium senegalense]
MAELAIEKEDLKSEKMLQDKPKSLKYRVLRADEAEKLIKETKQQPVGYPKTSMFEKFKDILFTKLFKAKIEQYKKLEEKLKEQEKIINDNNNKFEEEKEQLKKIIDVQEDEIKLFKKEFNTSKETIRENLKEKLSDLNKNKSSSPLSTSNKSEKDNIKVDVQQNNVVNTKTKEEKLNKDKAPIQNSQAEKASEKVENNSKQEKKTSKEQVEEINFFNGENPVINNNEPKIGLVERLKESIYVKYFEGKANEFIKLQEKVVLQGQSITENNIKHERELQELKKRVELQRKELENLKKELKNRKENEKKKEELDKPLENGNKSINQKDLNKMIKEHEEWIKTSGKKGKQLNLENMNLQGTKLLNVDLRTANLKNANLNNCSIYADLRGSNLKGIKINDKTSFTGSNLKNATMDKNKEKIIKNKLNKDINKHNYALKDLKTNSNNKQYDR